MCRLRVPAGCTRSAGLEDRDLQASGAEPPTFGGGVAPRRTAVHAAGDGPAVHVGLGGDSAALVIDDRGPLRERLAKPYEVPDRPLTTVRHLAVAAPCKRPRATVLPRLQRSPFSISADPTG